MNYWLEFRLIVERDNTKKGFISPFSIPVTVLEKKSPENGHWSMTYFEDNIRFHRIPRDVPSILKGGKCFFFRSDICNIFANFV